MLANKVKGKRPRDQHNKTSSGISPPTKRPVKTARKRKTTKQPCISGWVTEDDTSCTQKTDATLNTLIKSTVAATSPLSTQSNQMLSPILSQPRNSVERSQHLEKNSTPISEALNLAASATSLREDIAACEQIMTERHHFLVSMLDGMDRKVSIIGEKFKDLEQRVNKLEKHEHTHRSTAASMYHETIQRQSVLEKKCEKVDEMCSRITEIEQYLTKQTSKQQHSDIKNNQNNYIAIYGLLEKHDDVTKTVNELLYEMNLRNMKCISAYRTPYRHDIQRQGVVIAEMKTNGKY